MKKNETTEEQQKTIKETNEGIENVDRLLKIWTKTDKPTDKDEFLAATLVESHELENFPTEKIPEYMLGGIADVALGKILSNPEIQNLPPDEMIKIATKAIANPIEKMNEVDYHDASGARTYNYKKSDSGDKHPATKNKTLAEEILNAAQLKNLSITPNEGEKPNTPRSNSKEVTQGKPKSKRPSIN